MFFSDEQIKIAEKLAWDMLDGWNHAYCPELRDYAFFYYNGKVVIDPWMKETKQDLTWPDHEDKKVAVEIVLERYEGSPLSSEDKIKLATQKNETYRELLKTMTPDDASDEVRNTLKELRKRGYLLSLGSSSKNAKFILEKIDLLDAFDAISDGNNITNSKPDPEVFLKAAEFLNVNPEDCLVIEDATAEIDAAKSANMLAAGIGDAKSYKLTDYELTSFSDLLTIAV